MGLFGTADKDDRQVEVPAEIFAHISVLGDHAPEGTSDDTEKPMRGVGVPSMANPIPHGSAEVFSDGQPVSSPLAENIDTPVSFAVSPEMAESSPFLQSLPPQERMVPQKEKGGVEPPMFLTENSQSNGFGFNQPQSNMFAGGFSPAVGAKSISFKDTASSEPIASHSRKALWIFSGIFVVLAFGLGAAYYFLYVYSAEPAMTERTESMPMAPTVSDMQAGGGQRSSEFSLDSANYLSLNVETVSGNEIRAQLKKTADRIRKEGIASSVEFLVTDQNNTPIAFSRFVLLAGMKIPEEIIDAADERFSIFVLAEPERARIGLIVTMKQDVALPALFKKTEGELAVAMQTFFLEENISPVKKAVFKQGAYRDIPVRYSNVPGTENLSVDYASVNNLWYIGTSKEVVRGMLDYGKK